MRDLISTNFSLCKTLIKDIFKDTFDGVFEHLAAPGEPVLEDNMRSLMFGDYMNPDLEENDRVYEEVKSVEEFNSVVETSLEEYNNTHKNAMNLVIFR